MVLRNKDGSIYRLKSPNELMKNQMIWHDYVLHNMQWLSSVYKHEEKVNKVQTNFNIPKESPKNFIEELEETKTVEIETQREVEVIPVKIVTPSHQTSAADNIKKTFMFCLPARIVKKRDALYDEEYNSVEYENPFTFESVVILEQDLSYKFWATLKLENESVIYPKANSKRWWKVSGKENKGNGFIYNCIPSSYQPHFEGV